MVYLITIQSDWCSAIEEKIFTFNHELTESETKAIVDREIDNYIGNYAILSAEIEDNLMERVSFCVERIY